MRLGVGFLALLAIPILAHNTPLQREMNRHPQMRSVVEHLPRQVTPQASGGILGGILGHGNSDGTTSSQTTPISKPTDTDTDTDSLGPSTTTTPIDTDTRTTTTPLLPTSSTPVSPILPSSVNTSTPLSSSTTSKPLNSSIASSTNTSSTIPSSVPASQTMSTSINAAGQTTVVTMFYTASEPVSTSSTASASSSAAVLTGDNSSSSSIGTPAIIGICVGVGAVVLALIGCAIWRMKRRNGDEDEAIRWPELNRHGDSDAHHALPARQTGQHGIETSPLERSLSNSSSVFASMPRDQDHYIASTAMALNGSNFGAANSLDYYDEKAYPSAVAPFDAYATSHPDEMYGTHTTSTEDYASMPPPMQNARNVSGTLPNYAGSDDEEVPGAAGIGAASRPEYNYRL